jgi:predicted nucleic acid-binding protein
VSVKLRTRQLAPTQRAEVLAVFAELVERSFNVLPISRLEFCTAARVADQYQAGLRAGDTLHLAIAGNDGTRIRTLDHRLATAAEALGVSAALL